MGLRVPKQKPLKEKEDKTAGFLNSMYLTGRPATIKDYKVPFKGGRTGSR